MSGEIHQKLRDAIHARAEAEKLHGRKSKEYEAADAIVAEIQRELPKPMGAKGPRWK